ncbi:MAG: hypothetical protein K6V36_11620 [Anaerolineae bacterium]|nr:hypothetical protein [Anaerolineae bacterium]
MRRILPALVALLVGPVVLLDYFLENPVLDAAGRFLLEGAIVLAASALLLGLWNLLLVHERQIRRREPGWPASVVILLSTGATLALGLAGWGSGALTWFYRFVLFPLEASTGALLAFVAVSAAVRAWRLSSLEGGVMLVVGVIVLVGTLAPQGPALTALGPLRDWIVSVPAMAAVRGILLGVALGIIATGLRVLLWIDRPYE